MKQYHLIVQRFIKFDSDQELNISGKLKLKTLAEYEKQKNSKEWILDVPLGQSLKPIKYHM